ncbi:uncharacterized protein OGAPODRAFT_7049 [Ogataea polymorpha]|nr:uncharacterized protein OGAPODRAFT_7049 [Ogataea polymorpha]OBA17554.1 hypothetical protein OGAPODRAFT_7049 [Ogataea polymorpha]
MVVHILGKAIKGKAKIGLAHTFFGVGLKTAEKICAKVGLYPSMRMHQLNETQVMAVTKELTDMTIGSRLLQQVRSNIKLKRAIGSYQGLRHAMGLPVHGQRTKYNARTARRLNKLNRTQ